MLQKSEMTRRVMANYKKGVLSSDLGPLAEFCPTAKMRRMCQHVHAELGTSPQRRNVETWTDVEKLPVPEVLETLLSGLRQFEVSY